MASGELRVEVVFSPCVGQVERRMLTMPAGSRVRDAIERSGLLNPGDLLPGHAPTVGVWGALRRLDDALRDLDRVEIYRSLLVDPKEARRLRHRRRRDGA